MKHNIERHVMSEFEDLEKTIFKLIIDFLIHDNGRFI